MGQYFSNEKLESKMKKYNTKIYNTEFVFNTDNGVFCKDKLDFGTRVFLENIPMSEIHGEVLDVGCGYGPIGITIAKLTNSNVEMIDVNKRSIHLSEINIRENHIDNIKAIESNCYENIDKDKKYDFILTNPPIRAGKKIVYEIVMNAKEHLKQNGKLFIVIRKEQGAKSMINDLSKYYNVTILEKNKGFFILSCRID